MSINSVGSGTPVTAAQIQGMDLETAMMMVQSDRANNLEVQLKGQLKSVADRNAQIAELNSLLTALRTQRPGGSDTEKWANLGADQAAGKALYDKVIKAGLTMPTGGDEVNEPGTGIYDAKQKTFDTWAEEIKGKIDSLSSTQQMDMLRLQSLSNKRNEAFELMTNFIKKFSDSNAGIIQKM
ncbi:MAG: hypothetical protein H6R18_421 [Proteobacteria bacterium]|nr:hypothetical protein [Pseudomonadota bacterium]